MLLELAHPEVSTRTCDVCQRWMFDTESGRLIRNRATGEPVERPAGTRTPCPTCPKCQNEANPCPETGRLTELSARNRSTLSRYWEHQASGATVMDDITQRNFGVIHETIDNYDRGLSKSLLIMVGNVRR